MFLTAKSLLDRIRRDSIVQGSMDLVCMALLAISPGDSAKNLRDKCSYVYQLIPTVYLLAHEFYNHAQSQPK